MCMCMNLFLMGPQGQKKKVLSVFGSHEKKDVI